MDQNPRIDQNTRMDQNTRIDQKRIDQNLKNGNGSKSKQNGSKYKKMDQNTKLNQNYRISNRENQLNFLAKK